MKYKSDTIMWRLCWRNVPQNQISHVKCSSFFSLNAKDLVICCHELRLYIVGMNVFG